MKLTTFMISKNIFQRYDVVKYGGFSLPEGRMVIGKLIRSKPVFEYNVIILKPNKDRSILDKFQIFLAKAILFIKNK